MERMELTIEHAKNEGVFPHAGSIREVNLRKREWVLRGSL